MSINVGDRVRVHWGKGWRDDLKALGPIKGIVRHVVDRHGVTMIVVRLDQLFNERGQPSAEGRETSWSFEPEEIEVIP